MYRLCASHSPGRLPSSPSASVSRYSPSTSSRPGTSIGTNSNGAAMRSQRAGVVSSQATASSRPVAADRTPSQAVTPNVPALRATVTQAALLHACGHSAGKVQTPATDTNSSSTTTVT